jgi:hypothetical protein
MGKQGQHQLKGEVATGILETIDGFNQHELPNTRGVHEG